MDVLKTMLLASVNQSGTDTDDLMLARVAINELIEAQEEYFFAIDEGNDDREFRAEQRLRKALAGVK